RRAHRLVLDGAGPTRRRIVSVYRTQIYAAPQLAHLAATVTIAPVGRQVHTLVVVTEPTVLVEKTTLIAADLARRPKLLRVVTRAPTIRIFCVTQAVAVV